MDDGNQRLRCKPSICATRCLLALVFWLSSHSFAYSTFVSSTWCVPKRSASWAVRVAVPKADKDDAAEPSEFIPEYTGVVKKIEWKLDRAPVPVQTEIDLLKSGVLCRRGEFFDVPEDSDRMAEIERKCRELGMTPTQGLLVRKQALVSRAASNSWKLERRYDEIERAFLGRRRTLRQLSKELDLPPVNIARAMLRVRVERAYPDMRRSEKRTMVKNIINESDQQSVAEFLSDWELDQLQIAKRLDDIGLTPMRAHVEASKWEEAIYAFLKEQGVNFLTEEDMRAANSATTPDVLILDNCIINGQPVRWIDAKNYYGSGLRTSHIMIKKTTKQIAKYEEAFGGSGAIMFKSGFSQQFAQSCPSTLFLDSGPLQIHDQIERQRRPE